MASPQKVKSCDERIFKIPHRPPYYSDENESDWKALYSAQCKCGKVKYSVSCEPLSSVICHCSTCKQLHGAPMQWAVIFEKSCVRMDKDSIQNLMFYSVHDNDAEDYVLPAKVSCRYCTQFLADEGKKMWLAFPWAFGFNTYDDLPEKWRVTDHINYAERVLDIDFTNTPDVHVWTGNRNKSERVR